MLKKGFKFSIESRKKMSESHLGQIPWHKGLTKEVDERLAKISEARKGIVFTKEWKEKISKAHKGKEYPEELYPNHGMRNKKVSEETRIKLSKALKGKKKPLISEEHKRHLITSHLGQIAWNKGLKKCDDIRVALSERTKKKISKGLKKAYQKNPELRKEIAKKLKGKIRSKEMRKNYSEAWGRRAESSGYPRNYLIPNFNIFASEVFKAIDVKLYTKGRYGGTKDGEKKIGKYFVDYYNENLKLIVEWNEPNHYDFYGNLNQKDIDKEKYIKKHYPDFQYIIIDEENQITVALINDPKNLS